MSRVADVNGQYLPHRAAGVYFEVVGIAGEPVGDGTPGPLSRAPRRAYLAHTAAA
ncbi:MAG TPA: hypothetical protein VGP52_05225 [Stellaceae bacterium]|jgi:hypothetical protein|nr:hypothetical protein [Stellaceae bacterium]